MIILRLDVGLRAWGEKDDAVVESEGAYPRKSALTRKPENDQVVPVNSLEKDLSKIVVIFRTAARV